MNRLIANNEDETRTSVDEVAIRGSPSYVSNGREILLFIMAQSYSLPVQFQPIIPHQGKIECATLAVH